jgi:hypothetical protein
MRQLSYERGIVLVFAAMWSAGCCSAAPTFQRDASLP